CWLSPSSRGSTARTSPWCRCGSSAPGPSPRASRRASWFYASIYGTVFLFPQFLQAVHGQGPLGAGLRLLPWTATLMVVAPIAGGLVNRLGGRGLVVVGLLAQAVGMAWIGLIAAPDLAYAKLVAPLILAGAGVSMAMPAAQNAVLSAVATA